MDIFGFKITIILVVILGAIVRVLRVEPKSKTLTGIIIEKIIVFIVSILCGLLFLQPVMFLFGFPAAYELFVALLLSLAYEFILVKILAHVKNMNIGELLEDYAKWKRDKDGK